MEEFPCHMLPDTIGNRLLEREWLYFESAHSPAAAVVKHKLFSPPLAKHWSLEGPIAACAGPRLRGCRQSWNGGENQLARDDDGSPVPPAQVWCQCLVLGLFWPLLSWR